LDYVVFAVLVFYVLTVLGLFVLRRTQPDAPRPYRAIGYPIVPALYIVAASVILVVLLLYRTETTWPGMLIVLSAIPVYLLWRGGPRSARPEGRAGGLKTMGPRFERPRGPGRGAPPGTATPGRA